MANRLFLAESVSINQFQGLGSSEALASCPLSLSLSLTLATTTMSLRQLLSAIANVPALSEVPIAQCLQFIRFALISRPSLEFCTQDRQAAPAKLPLHISEIFAASFNWKLETVNACWAVLKDVIWTHDSIIPNKDEIELYNMHALHRGTCWSIPEMGCYFDTNT